MSDDVAKNPFSRLFTQESLAREYADVTRNALNYELETQNAKDTEASADELSRGLINDFIQRVFLITVKQDDGYYGLIQYGGVPSRCIYLKDLHTDLKDSSANEELGKEHLNQALLERLQMKEPVSQLCSQSGTKTNLEIASEQFARENRIVRYLFESFARLNKESEAIKRVKKISSSILVAIKDLTDECRNLIYDFTKSILTSPEVFALQTSIHKQVIYLLKKVADDNDAKIFMKSVLEKITDSEELMGIFNPVMNEFYTDLDSVTLLDPALHTTLGALNFLVADKELAKFILKSQYWLPNSPTSFGIKQPLNGQHFETHSLLGRLLRLSPIPTTNASEFFLSPSQQDEATMRAMTTNIQYQLDSLISRLHEILTSLIQADRHSVLTWFGLCLFYNKGREKMMFDPRSLCSSGFALNFTHMLLKFCEPFLVPSSKALLKVNCSYCATKNATVNSVQQEDTSVHMVGLDELEVMIKSQEENISSESVEQKFKFATEIFYMAHSALKIGWFRVFETYQKLMQELNKMSETYQEVRQQAQSTDVMQQFKDKFENGMRLQMSMKAHLLNRSLSDIAIQFAAASSIWLIQQVLCEENEDLSYKSFTSDTLPQYSPALELIPTMIPENIGETIRMLGGFQSDALDDASSLLNEIMKFFALFLGSSKRLYNPHTRGRLAECLAYFIPRDNSGLNQTSLLTSNIRAQIFEECGDVVAELLPEALLQLFVDIEFTGDSMEFYQKFSYRHYMYAVLEYIWNMPLYGKKFHEMYEVSQVAYTNDTIFTTFPRFISLLVNDTNHMLDEAFSNLRNIRTIELEKGCEAWNSLSQEEKEHKEAQLSEYSQHAKQYNIMAKETLHVIQYVTRDIKSPFVCLSMMESMASFLNYFLALLAGKERSQLKVTDFVRYNFSPTELLSMLVDIYLNLRTDDFCKVIVRDERSYSSELFDDATKLLRKISSDKIDEFQSLADFLKDLKAKLSEAKKDNVEPPDEFLDPISCTLMMDPVRLPSSGQVVDKSIISRHLLSDEKDPFNRSPLTLDQVIPLPELRARIVQWMKDNDIEEEYAGEN